MTKLKQFEVLNKKGNKTTFTMTVETIKMNSNEMNEYNGHIRGFIEKEYGDFGETRVGVKVGVHAMYHETFSEQPFEVMNDMLTELIIANKIKF